MWEWLAEYTTPVCRGNMLLGVLALLILGACVGAFVILRTDW